MAAPYDLAEAMADVARGLQHSGSMDETLSRITAAARDAVPGVDHVSITCRRGDGPLVTLAPTDSVSRKADELQYALLEGPCYEAALGAGLVASDDVTKDDRWPRYGPAAGELGIMSQLAVAIYDTPQSRAGLNLYSHQPGNFDDIHQVAELFATHAAVAMGHAGSVEQLNEALSTRKVIGQAIGIVMERYGIDQDRALEFLIRLSQTSNVKLRAVAAELVDQGNAR